MKFLVLVILMHQTAAWLFKQGSIHRRQTCAALVAAGLSVLNPMCANAETYLNDRYHTTFEIPKGWTASSGALSGERKIEAWIDPTSEDTSVSIVYTPIPADFTRLTSFGGGKDTIREYLVPRGEGIETEVLDEKVKGEAYTIEYVVSAPSQPTRHVITVFALRPAETVVGLTVQTRQESYDKNKDTLMAIVPSLRTNVNE